MIIKKKEKEKLRLKFPARIPKKKIWTALFFILFIFGTLTFGFLGGLFFSDFFGSINHPSQSIIWFIEDHNLEPKILRAQIWFSHKKEVLTEILKTNIQMIPNYFSGVHAKPERIYIDISFENLQRLEYNRALGLKKGILVSNNSEYVSVVLNYNGEKYPAKIRLKGDYLDHVTSKKWSFRVKLKDDKTINGISVFSLHNPKVKGNLNEWLFQKTLIHEGVLGLRTDFVEVFINGEKKGIYQFEEHFDKRLLEHNSRRESVTLKFDESLLWTQWYLEHTLPTRDVFVENFLNADIAAFQDGDLKEDATLQKYYIAGKTNLDLIRNGSGDLSQLADIDKFARYFAISEIFGAAHGLIYNNMRFYYNPVTSKIEPIGYDSNLGSDFQMFQFLKPFVGPYNEPFSYRLFQSEEFFRRYMFYLHAYSDKSFLDNLFKEFHEEIMSKEAILHKDQPYYQFSKEVFYRNQRIIQSYFNTSSVVTGYIYNNNQTVLELLNKQELPLEIHGVLTNDSYIPIPSLILYPKKPLEPPIPVSITLPKNISSFSGPVFINYSFLGLNFSRTEKINTHPRINPNHNPKGIYQFENQSQNLSLYEKNDAYIFEGNITISEPLVFPAGKPIVIKAGSRINIINNSFILSQNQIIAQASDYDQPIEVFSSDKTGGFVVLNANKISSFRNVVFDSLRAPSKDVWFLTGSITFYESNVSFEKVTFLNGQSEDLLNIILSEFSLKDISFKNSLYDCFDSDFSKGTISEISLSYCGNDALDFSGSNVVIENLKIDSAGDKGLSIGEQSSVDGSDIIIENSNMGIVSKDKSVLNLKNDVSLRNVSIGLAAFQKKSEFGPASIYADLKVHMIDVDTSYLLEKDSSISIQSSNIESNVENARGLLY